MDPTQSKFVNESNDNWYKSSLYENLKKKWAK